MAQISSKECSRKFEEESLLPLHFNGSESILAWRVTVLQNWAILGLMAFHVPRTTPPQHNNEAEQPNPFVSSSLWSQYSINTHTIYTSTHSTSSIDTTTKMKLNPNLDNHIAPAIQTNYEPSQLMQRNRNSNVDATTGIKFVKFYVRKNILLHPNRLRLTR